VEFDRDLNRRTHRSSSGATPLPRQPPEGGIWVERGEIVRGTEWLGRPLSLMKRPRYQRPTLRIGLIMALAIGTLAGVFGYYGVMVWRFFFD
jgi:hypothetical protein